MFLSWASTPGPTERTLSLLPSASSARSGGAIDSQPGLAARGFVMNALLARGASGSVYRATQEEPYARTIAVKVLASDDELVVRAFLQERSILAKIHHTNVVALLHAGCHGQEYFAMELVREGPLVAYSRAHRLSVVARLELFAQLVSAIQHLHANGVSHRDITVDNVLVAKRGAELQSKLIDFGVAMVRECPQEQNCNEWSAATREDAKQLRALLLLLLAGTDWDKRVRAPEDCSVEQIASEVDRLVKCSASQRPCSWFWKTAGSVVFVLLAVGTFQWVAGPGRADELVLARTYEHTPLLLTVARQEADQLWPYGEEVRLKASRWLSTYGAELTTIREQLRHQERVGHPIDEALLRDLERFCDRDPRVGHYAAVEKRFHESARVTEVSLQSDEAKEAWAEATQAIRNSELYEGLQIQPQEGLLPLGPGASGYWEFWHVASGKRPQRRGAHGTWLIEAETGLILVLLPGGDVVYGANRAVGSETSTGDFGLRIESVPTQKAVLSESLRAGDEIQRCNGDKIRSRGDLRLALVSGAPGDEAVLELRRDGRTETVSITLPWENLDGKALELTPSRRVNLSPYFVGVHEVTQSQWERAMGENPSHIVATATGESLPMNPVDSIAKAEVMQFLVQLGLDLPTEVQWEYAARGGSRVDFWWGPVPIADEKHRAGLSRRAEPVGRYPPNPYGLHDTEGNVFELCSDSNPRPEALARAGDGLRSGTRIGSSFRGGARCARRISHPDRPSPFRGLRVARKVEGIWGYGK